MHERAYYVYIMTNMRHTVLYTGMTNNIRRRVQEHQAGEGGYFTRRYNVEKLVYLEQYGDVHEALAREKQIKSGSRQRKIDLIDYQNPDWKDRSHEL